jgi:uncharacterized protein (DUF952 family)
LETSLSEPIYKIVDADVWADAESKGEFSGVDIDLADGFIHLSSEEQVTETLHKYFAGRTNLVLVSVDANLLGDSLRWEPSRGGALFPHVYGSIPMSVVIETRSIEAD